MAVRKIKRGGVSFSPKEDASPRERAREAAEVAAVADGNVSSDMFEQEFEMSESIDKLARAFVAFREKCPNMDKDRQGYNYKYTTLGNVIAQSRDHLKRAGLAVMQFPISSPRGLGVITMLVHDSGQFIRARFIMPIPKLSSTNVTQDAGAAISYARRYALSAVLCVASDEDTDASYDEGKSAKRSFKRR